MNIKKYLIGAGLTATILSGVASLALAENTDQKITGSNSHPQPMIVQIGPEGKTLLRGTIKTIGSNSLAVTSWGGDWIVNISSSTKLVPVNDLSQFKVGDFIGVQGMASQSAMLTIDNATLVRNWTEKKEMKDNRQEIKQIMKEESSQNWQGRVSNINVSGRSFTLTKLTGDKGGVAIESTAYMVNIIADAKIVNQKYLAISLSDMKDGDMVRVWGPLSDTTITASVVRDISIETPYSRNWQGIASNINVSERSLTLTIDGTAYMVNIIADAKIVNQKYLAISLSDMKDGDTVRVFGLTLGTTVTASVVRDISIP